MNADRAREPRPDDEPDRHDPIPDPIPSEKTMISVRVAESYSKVFWIGSIVFFPLLPILFWYKKAVVNRNRILFDPKSMRVTIEHGRWFVKDEDMVQVSAIDNVKLDNTVLGRIFGWCHISVVTRSAVYRIAYVSSDQAKAFRDGLRDAP